MLQTHLMDSKLITFLLLFLFELLFAMDCKSCPVSVVNSVLNYFLLWIPKHVTFFSILIFFTLRIPHLTSFGPNKFLTVFSSPYHHFSLSSPFRRAAALSIEPQTDIVEIRIS